MRKPVSLLAAAAIVMASAVPARAENSVACLYLLMRIYHAQMDACKTPLDGASEAGYKRVRGQFETFIAQNAKQDPKAIIANVDATAQKSAATAKCKSMEFAQVKEAMKSFTSPFGETQLRENLKRKRDPQAGSCA